MVAGQILYFGIKRRKFLKIGNCCIWVIMGEEQKLISLCELCFKAEISFNFEEQNNIIQELLDEQIIEDVHHEPEEINHIFYFE